MKTSTLIKPKFRLLIERYQQLQKEAFEISAFNPKYAEQKYKEAQYIIARISNNTQVAI